MSNLLALSFDVAASPSISLRRAADSSRDEFGSGWGFAWYPADSLSAAVVRDPRPLNGVGMTKVLSEWGRFSGTVFLCHVRGAAKRPTEQDTHPFTRCYAGRGFTFAHNGQLDPVRARALPLGDDPVFEPIGTTDSEQAFCWLLTKMRAMQARRFADVGYETLRTWLQELNELGTLNVVMSDGQDVIAYSDKSGHRPLSFVRRTPPHDAIRLQNAVLELDHSDPADSVRTISVVATTPLSEGWTAVGNGHLLVLRRGAVFHTSATMQLVPPANAAPVLVDNGWRATPLDVVSPTRTAAMASPQLQLAANGTGPAERDDAQSTRRYRVVHKTIYDYEKPVERSSHVLRLHPEHDLNQRVISQRIDITSPCESSVFDDVFGNRSMRVLIEEPYARLEIAAESIVEVNVIDTPAPPARTTLPLVWMPWQRQMMTPYLLPAELPETQLEELSSFALSFAARQDYDVLETLRDINRTIRSDFAYVQGVTSNETTPFDAYVSRRGVCQDFANLFICLARLLGVPARYRVGYIHTGSNYENQLQSEASHAWAEAYLPWVGWRGFDPTNGCAVGLDHVAVASGRNYRDATPTSGTLYEGGGGEKLKVIVEVKPIDDNGNEILLPIANKLSA